MTMRPISPRIALLPAAGEEFRAALADALKRLWNAVKERLALDPKPSPVPVPVRVRR